MDKPPQKVNKIVAKFFLWACKVNTVISKKREFISPGRSRIPVASEMEFFVTVMYASNSSILDIAGDPRPTLRESFSIAASTLVSSAIFPLRMVLIMKAKSGQWWILKAILWRHYYSITGLEKAILIDFQHNMSNLQCHTSHHPHPPPTTTTTTLPLPNPNQIVIYIRLFGDHDAIL